MATSPFPFFPTTTPAYVPTTVFPPPPVGFGVPYAPYPPPNPIHHHPLPPPSPPYHYAAVYPPPPPGFVPVPTYAPAPAPPQPSPTHQHPPYLWSTPPTPCSPPFPFGFSPDPAYGHGSFPCSQALPSESTAAPTPAPPPTGVASLSAPPETALLRHPDQVPSAPYSSSSGGYCSAPALPYEPQWPPPAPNPPTIQAPPQPTTTSSTPVSDSFLTSVIRVKHQATTAPSTSSSGRLLDSPWTTSAPAAALIVLCSGPGPERRPSSSSPAPVPDPSASRAPASSATPANAVQRHATDRFLNRLPSSSNTTTGQTTSAGFTPTSGSTTKVASAPSMFSNTSAAASYLNSPFGPSLVVPTPTLASVSATSETTSASTLPSVTAYVAPQVFGEMPNPAQSSCMHGGMTDLTEQHLDGRPQPYDFSNLTRQGILLADGTEHSYFTLPADYHLEQAVSEPVFDVYADETEDCSSVFVDVLADSFGQSNAFVDVLARNSVQQPYEVEQRQSHRAPKCFSNPNFSPERPIVGTDIEQPLHLSIDEELQGDEKLLGEQSVCQSAIEHSFLNFLWDPGDARLHTLFTTSARATKFPSTHAYKCAMLHIPVGQFGASRAPSFQCAIMLSAVFGLGWTALHASALFLLVAPCSTGKYRCLPSFAMSKQQWDPGIDLFSYKKLHLFSWIPPSAILILQQLHYKNISSMWDCSLEKGNTSAMGSWHCNFKSMDFY